MAKPHQGGTKKDHVGLWKKGQSGNPSGRKPKSFAQKEFEERCRKYLWAKGFETLEKMVEKGGRDRMWALGEMLNRGFGKPRETIDLTTHEGSRDIESITGEMADIIGGTEGVGIIPPVGTEGSA